MSAPRIAVGPGPAPWAAEAIRRGGGQVVALDEADRARAAALHLHLEPLTLQQVVVRAAAASVARPPQKNAERTSA
jgi:hypothetical protein